MKITSVNNQKILGLRKLYKNRERKASDVFIVEGVKEVSRGVSSGFSLKSIYYSPEIFNNDLDKIIGENIDGIDVFELDKKVYEKIAYRDNTEGIIALFDKKKYSLEELQITENDLFIVLESLEKPGNLGAVLRTADAAGVSCVILTESKVDNYHPNVIRSSIGAAFSVPVIISSNSKVKDWMKDKGINSFAAALPAYDNIYELNLKESTALIFGTESDGLSKFWLDNADHTYTIPMTGIVDSLNVSVSVAVSVFEAVRQGGLK